MLQIWKVLIPVEGAILHGAMLPGFSALFGELFNTFFKTPGTSRRFWLLVSSHRTDQIREDIVTISLFFVLLGCASFIVTYFQVRTQSACTEDRLALDVLSIHAASCESFATTSSSSFFHRTQHGWTAHPAVSRYQTR